MSKRILKLDMKIVKGKIKTKEFETSCRKFSRLHDFLITLVEKISINDFKKVKKFINTRFARFQFSGIPEGHKLTASKWLNVFKDYSTLFPLNSSSREDAFSLHEFLLYINYLTSMKFPKNQAPQYWTISVPKIDFRKSFSDIKEKLLSNPIPSLEHFLPMVNLFKYRYDDLKRTKNDKSYLLSGLKDIKIAYSIYMEIFEEISDSYIKRVGGSFTAKTFQAFVKELIFRLICYFAKKKSDPIE